MPPKSASAWFAGEKTTPPPYLPIATSSSSVSVNASGSSASGPASSSSERSSSPPASANSKIGRAFGLGQRHIHRSRESVSSDSGSGSTSTLLGNGAGAYHSSSPSSSSAGMARKLTGGAAASTRQWAEKGSEAFSSGMQALSNTSYRFDFWAIVRRLLSLTLQGGSLFVVLAFAIYGGYMFITMRFSGRYMRIPVYTKYDIGQAGWQRPILLPSEFKWNSPNSPKTQHDGGAAATLETLPNTVPVNQITESQKGTTTIQLYDFDRAALGKDGQARKNVDDLHILILTPLKNAVDTIDKFWTLLEGLEHPKENISIGFLIGDEEDETGKMVHEWVLKQRERGAYRKITLLKKDFGLVTPGGEARHKNWIQAQRRSLMGKARTLLLTSTLEPTVDWVFWLDSDLTEAPKSLLADLLYYGNGGVNPSITDQYSGAGAEALADVITPNIMRRLGPGQIQGYDLNNWAETPQSLRMKAKLPADRILHEGNVQKPTYRTLLARSWVPPNITSTWNDNSPHFPYIPEIEGPTDLYDPESDAYIGRTMELDGVGGVATLVRADTHRFGAVFPSWVQDHQVETEGFGVLARLAGARIVGLPNYLVYHHFPEYGMLNI